MSDVNWACTFLLAVLVAGALRAFLAARISIFYLSLFAVSVNRSLNAVNKTMI
jgi:hypothetical protein